MLTCHHTTNEIKLASSKAKTKRVQQYSTRLPRKATFPAHDLSGFLNVRTPAKEAAATLDMTIQGKEKSPNNSAFFGSYRRKDENKTNLRQKRKNTLTPATDCNHKPLFLCSGARTAEKHKGLNKIAALKKALLRTQEMQINCFPLMCVCEQRYECVVRHGKKY